MTHFYQMNGKKLLVADDSLTIQKVIRLALSNEGYEIQAVSDGNDAVQQIAVFRPDIVLIDVSLPGKTAFEVKQLTESQDGLDQVRFVLMSSAFERVDEQQIETVRFHGRLTKPFDPAHLRQTLSSVLAKDPEKPSSVASMPPLPPGPSQKFAVPAEPPAAAASENESKGWPKLPDLPEFPDLPDMPDMGEPELSNLADDNSYQPLKDLWDKEPQIVMPAPELSTGAADSERDPDADIRHLTESTIRMSGLDDFQWTVNEPTLKPGPAMMDRGASNFPLEQAAGPRSQPTPSPAVPTPPSLAPPTPIESPPFLPASRPGMPDGITIGEASETQQIPPPFAPSGSSSFPREEMEDLIRKQVEKNLEELARKFLPELAERVIKDEIRRLLSEQP